MSSNTSHNYLNNRYLNLCVSYPKVQMDFNGMKFHLNKSEEFSKKYDLSNLIIENKQNFNQTSKHNQFNQIASLTERKNNNEENNINPLDILDNVSFIKILDLNSVSSIINLSKIKYVKLINKNGNVTFKELHKKDFNKSLLKKYSSLDVLDDVNIKFINFVDFNNNVNSISLDQIQLIKLYDKKINTILTKTF